MGIFGKKFSAPVAKPMAPFFIAGLVILYGVNAAQNAMMGSDEFKNDPRNPNYKGVKKTDAAKH